jgi:flagellar hook-associated protein 2
MALSSTSSSTTQTGKTLDVAGIVSGLMEAENAPVKKLDASISKSTVKITSLGLIKSQLSTLKSALADLQTPANFTKQAAKFSNTSNATAEFTATATAASYQMEVTSLAQPNIWNVSGFTTSADALAWYDNAAQAAVKTSADATVFQSSTGQFVLSLKSKTAGAAGNFTVPTPSAGLAAENYQVATNAEIKLNGVTFTRTSNTVSDALTGITFNLTSKTVVGTPITLTVSNDAVSARTKLDALVKSYNDLYATYKSQTASSMDVATRGILNSDFGVKSMMRQLVSGLMLPVTNLTGGAWSYAIAGGAAASAEAQKTLTLANTTGLTVGMFVTGTNIATGTKIASINAGVSVTLDTNIATGGSAAGAAINFYDKGIGSTDLSSLGLKLLVTGNLAIDETLLSAASSTLQTRLAAGIRIGYSSTTSTDLSTQIGEMLFSGGLIQDRIDKETSSKTAITNRKTTLQQKLVGIQASYTAQYAALDALLFKLQGTSDSLKSALDGLTNSQKNN